MSERKTIYLCLAHMSDEGWEQKYVKEAFDTNWVVPMGLKVIVTGHVRGDFLSHLSSLHNLLEEVKALEKLDEMFHFSLLIFNF